MNVSGLLTIYPRSQGQATKMMKYPLGQKIPTGGAEAKKRVFYTGIRILSSKSPGDSMGLI